MNRLLPLHHKLSKIKPTYPTINAAMTDSCLDNPKKEGRVERGAERQKRVEGKKDRKKEKERKTNKRLFTDGSTKY
jgi:hypothetical protein